ncbi:MAG: SDR family NAD(P)-dependent oxidoreductase, partial [Chthoniobacterales bacterium]
DQTVFAGMGFIEAALALGQRVLGTKSLHLEDVAFERVLIVDPTTLQNLVTEHDEEEGRFKIYSRVEGSPAQRHCAGRLVAGESEADSRDLDELRAECPDDVPVAKFYERLAERELHYGPMFQPVVSIATGTDCFFITIEPDAAARDEDHPLHPVIFDAALQGVIFQGGGDRLYVPLKFAEFRYFGHPEEGCCHAFGRILEKTPQSIVADVDLFAADGRLIVRAKGVSLQVIELREKPETASGFYRMPWRASPLEPLAPSDSSVAGTSVALVGDPRGEIGRELIGRLPDALVVDSVEPEVAEWDGRSQIVVLWGADPLDDPLAGHARAIRFLQRLAVGPEVRVIFVTRGAQSVLEGEGVPNLAAAGLGALGLLVRNECDGVRCLSVDVDDLSAGVAVVFSELAGGREGSVAYRGGERFEAVIESAASFPTDERRAPVDDRLVAGNEGRFARVGRVNRGDGEITLRVSISSETDGPAEGIGTVEECGRGGRFARGERVAALLPAGVATWACVPEDFVVSLPEGVSGGIGSELKVYRGLIDLADLRDGERVLVLGATDVESRAAIRIARWKGASPRLVVASREEREEIEEPGVDVLVIPSGGDLAIRLRESLPQGEGFDVIFCGGGISNATDLLGLLRAGGRLVATGSAGEDRWLAPGALRRNVTISTVDLPELMRTRPDLIRRGLDRIAAHWKDGDFRPEEPLVLAVDEWGNLDRSRDRGWVDLSSGTVPVASGGAAIRLDGAYVVTGGTSGFGLLTAEWLVSQGAGRVVIASRSGSAAQGLTEPLERMRSMGAEVEVVAADLTDRDQVRSLLQTAQSGEFRLRGIVHSAMVLDDALLGDVTDESFERVCRPKVDGALNLVAGLDGIELDFLILYSSVSSLIGNRGQTSYVVANALLDGLARELRARGLPAVSVNWGALAESGVVARDARLGALLSSAGIGG